MNEELLQLYVEALLQGGFSPEYLTTGHPSTVGLMFLEHKLGRKQGYERVNNPEFQEALKILESPLMKALK